VFILFRFLGGVGVGVSSVTAPIYISEISPAGSRGKLVGLFQFNVVLGILVAYLSNYFIGQMEGESWRWMLGVQAFPSLLFFVLIFLVPESPRWLLLHRDRREEALSITKRINAESYREEVGKILAGRAESARRRARGRPSEGSDGAIGAIAVFRGRQTVPKTRRKIVSTCLVW